MDISRRNLLIGGGIVALGAAGGARALTLGDASVEASGSLEMESAFVRRASFLLNDVAAIDGLTPVAAARFAAYGALACSACFAGSGLLNKTTAAPTLPTAPTNLHPAAAATAALSVLLPGLLGTPTPAAWATIRNELRIEAAIHNQASNAAVSSQYGVQLGLAMAQWAASDGYFGVARPLYTASTDPARWRPDAHAKGAPPVDAMVGLTTRPMFINSVDDHLVTPSAIFDMHAGSTYRQEVEEVHAMGVALTPEQKEQASFWSDGRHESGTVAGHWLVIAGGRAGLAAAPSVVMATLATGIYDALLACWHTKYTTDCARPQAVINENVDGSWKSFLTTPNFPEFTSGHSAASGAASHILTTLVGDNQAFTDKPRGAGMPVEVAERTFSSFLEAAKEAADSRMLGGVHFRSACELGLRQGVNVSNSALLAALST